MQVTELQEITENMARSTENLTAQLEGESSDDLPMRELLGLDKLLKTIRGLLSVAEKVQLEERIEREKRKLEEIRDNPEYDDGIREDIWKRIAKLNDDLSVRQESIDILNGRLKDEITSFKETIAKVLDKDTSLAKKSGCCFRNMELWLLPLSWLLEWLSAFWFKHCFLGAVGVREEEVSLNLKTKKVWNNAGINLTGYHPPRADRRATNFFRQNPCPRDSFSVQNSGPRVEKRNKIPIPGHNFPS